MQIKALGSVPPHSTCRRDGKTQIGRGTGGSAGLMNSVTRRCQESDPEEEPTCRSRMYRCLSAPALLPARVFVLLGDCAPQGQPASSPGASSSAVSSLARPHSDCLALEVSPSAPCCFRMMVPRFLLSAFSHPTPQPHPVFSSPRKGQVETCGELRHPGRKLICLGSLLSLMGHCTQGKSKCGRC